MTRRGVGRAVFQERCHSSDTNALLCQKNKFSALVSRRPRRETARNLRDLRALRGRSFAISVARGSTRESVTARENCGLVVAVVGAEHVAGAAPRLHERLAADRTQLSTKTL